MLSAFHGLCMALADSVPGVSGGTIAFILGFYDDLLRALQGLQLGQTPDAVLTDVEEAMEAMGEVTGATVREDITARIFQRFCVGK